MHQGETASSGHYWAFVRDRNEKWWKCNDGDVTQATWLDVCNDAYGGSSGSASAYSLIYQSQDQFDLDADTPDEELEPDQNGTLYLKYFEFLKYRFGRITRQYDSAKG